MGVVRCTMTHDANFCEYKREMWGREKEQRAVYPRHDRRECIYPPSVDLLVHTWKSTSRWYASLPRVSTLVERCPLQCFTGAAKEVRPLLIILRSFSPIKPFASPSVKKIPTVPPACVCLRSVRSRDFATFERLWTLQNLRFVHQASRLPRRRFA